MKALAEQCAEIDAVEIYGRVAAVCGLMVEVAGPIHAMSVGARLTIETGAGRLVPCEVVGFAGERGRYPAINFLKSISRTIPRAADPRYPPVSARPRAVMATYARNGGADQARRLPERLQRRGGRDDRPILPLEAFLAQG